MFEIHQPRPVVREVGREDSPLPMCEGQGMEKVLKGEEEAQARNKKRHRAAKAKGGSSGEGNKRDPNLDNPAVKKYRDIVHLQANYLQREEIALTVKNERLWEAILLEWMLAGRNPKNVLGMLRQYELGNGHL